MNAEPSQSHAARLLAGKTVLQAVPGMQDDWIGHAALNTAVALLRVGARSLVVGGGGRLVGELQALGGEWIEFDVTGESPMRRGRSARGLAELAATEHIDLAHAHGSDAGRLAMTALRGGTVPLVATYVGAPPAPTWRRPAQDDSAHAAAVIAFSAFAADLVAKRHGVPRERLAVIPRSVDTGWFDPATVRPERIAALRHAWRIEPGDRIVLAPGRLGAAQGHVALIDAVRILVNGGLRSTVFVIASQSDGENFGAVIDQRIAAQGLGPIFRRVGHYADMPGAYAASDLVVLPMERAPIFSTIAIEAQATARPLIATRVGALPELIHVGANDSDADRTGWITRPRDSMALARTLAQALTLGPDRMRGIGARARRFAERRFAPEPVTEATLGLYASLLEQSR